MTLQTETTRNELSSSDVEYSNPRAARLHTKALSIISFVFYLFYFPPFSICNVFQYHLRDGAESTSAQNNFSHVEIMDGLVLTE